jgi:hypothetical protein
MSNGNKDVLVSIDRPSSGSGADETTPLTPPHYRTSPTTPSNNDFDTSHNAAILTNTNGSDNSSSSSHAHTPTDAHVRSADCLNNDDRMARLEARIATQLTSDELVLFNQVAKRPDPDCPYVCSRAYIILSLEFLNLFVVGVDIGGDDV